MKVLAHIHSMIEQPAGRGIRPIHPQIYLSNRCQLKCSYCSCAKRGGKDMHIDPWMFRDYVTKLKLMGAKAVTITGGGEPLLHPDFPTLLGELKCIHYKVGMATNGIAIREYDPNLFTEFDWIRISMDSKRDELPEVPRGLKHAFSYVFRETDDGEDAKLAMLIAKARKGAITHLRIVSDIIRPKAGRKLAEAVAKLTAADTLPANVILQNRAEHTPGSKKCWISLMKPVIDVDGQVYPCCGAQYALKRSERRMPAQMSMGSLYEYLADYVNPQRPFDGSRCRYCYYRKYNDLLALVMKLHDVEDMDFV